MQISNLQQPIITIDYRVFFAVLLGLIIFSNTLNAQNSTQTIKKEIYSDKQIKVEVEFKLYNTICKDLNKSNKYTFIVTGQLYSYAKEANWNFKYIDCNGNQQNEKNSISIGGKDAVIGRIESVDYIFVGKLVDSTIIVTPPSPPPTTNSNLFSLSKTDISFKSSGGNEYITVNSNSNPYSIELLPSWCTVQKNSTSFSLNCINNYSSSSRTDYFNVKFGNQTIKVNVKQEGFSSVIEDKLEASKTDLFFSYDSGNIETINISTNAIDFYTTYVPGWCNVTKYKSYIKVECKKNDTGQKRSDWFKVYIDKKEVKINVTQYSNPKSSTKPPRFNLLGPFSSIGFQSGEIAKYGFIYERYNNRKLGFHISVRSSNTSSSQVLNPDGTVLPNKAEIDLGPNFNIYDHRIYLNLGIGYGTYNSYERNDFAGTFEAVNVSYFESSIGGMYRLNKLIGINMGASFMNIHEDLYKPEIIFGFSFNLKK